MKNYINIYNNLIKLTRNKLLYLNINKDETFSERLIFFLLHFSFFLKIYKNEISKKEIQEIYDFIFRQLELSIREIGYGDVSINKKMKDYINFLHKIIGDIDNWDELSYENKMVFLLKKNTLNSFINNIIDLKF